MQDVLAQIIVWGAVLIALYKIIDTIFFTKKKSGCGGGCSSCSAKEELLIHIKHNKKMEFRSLKMSLGQ